MLTQKSTKQDTLRRLEVDEMATRRDMTQDEYKELLNLNGLSETGSTEVAAVQSEMTKADSQTKDGLGLRGVSLAETRFRVDEMATRRDMTQDELEAIEKANKL